MGVIKKIVSVSITSILLFSSIHLAQAATEKRLAYSKSLGVDVIAVGENWCSETAAVTLKSDSSSFFEGEEVKTFMVKIGKAVLPVECPQATELKVVGQTSNETKTIFTTLTKKSDDWQIMASETITENEALPEEKIPEEIDNKIVQSQSEQALPTQREESEEQGVQGEESASKTEAESEQIALEKANIDEQIEVQKETPEVFEIGGYQPNTTSTRLQFDESIVEQLITIDDCKINILKGDMGSLNVIAFPEGEFSCQNGLLEGSGTITFKTIDGVKTKSHEVTLINGFLFKDIKEGWTPQRIIAEKRAYVAIFDVGSNAEIKSHFVAFYRSNRGVFALNDIYAITDKAFLLNEDNLQNVVDKVGDVRVANGMKEYNSFFIYDSLESIQSRDIALKVSKPYVNGAKYQYENLLKKREEKRLAELKRQEEKQRIAQLLEKKKKEEALAREIQQQKQREAQLVKKINDDYQRLLKMDEAQRKNSILGKYKQTLEKSDYRAAAKSALGITNIQSRWLVYIDDVSDKEVSIEFPSKMNGTSTTQISPGWYIVNAKLSGELGKTDKSGLIQPTLMDIAVERHCEEEKCNDFSDPLKLIRQKYNKPDWQPQS